ncbi:SHOCT domain-containing protein [Pseudooceanicola sp. LIPI14-2-Ac024]|uniref:SHOCT domain-containing protein n=1 Tax=Pseudooceanicola sp. LIPI14-2-Ac024 TaxID=3344875 RepID=UPI0035D0C02E
MKRLSIPALLLLAGPVYADPDDYGHMMNWGYGFGMIFGPILWIIVLGLVVAGVIWLVRGTGQTPAKAGSSAMAELDLRLARGEIDAEDYAARKKLLNG